MTPLQNHSLEAGPSRRVRLGRLLLSLPLAAYILGAPACRAVHGQAPPYLRWWAMFDGAGLGVCSVDFRDRAGTAIDRYRPFGAADFRTAPDRVRFMANGDDARAVARELCPSLAPDERVRVWVQCPTPGGWSEPSSEEIDCRDSLAPTGAR